ncbi:MAG: glycosyltransferase, partial [Candidatus Wildermuthbacteria bacterium]|nr:glycosyltransferase [Candidatus Wildermuthbacteria bacterium]
MEQSRQKPVVAFFFPNLDAGGAERTGMHILRALDREKFQPSLILGEKRGFFVSQIPSDVAVRSFGISNLARLIFYLTKYLRKEQPEICVSMFPRFTMAMLFARLFIKSKTKYVIIEHTPISHISKTAKTPLRRLFARFLLPLVMRLTYSHADAVVCVSKGIADDLRNFAHVVKNVRVIYNPIIHPELLTLAREKIDYPWFAERSIPIIVASGRLVKAKDFPMLLHAFARVRSSATAHLVLLGEGGERESLQNLSKELGIEEDVAFIGFQENPYAFMGQAHVF